MITNWIGAVRQVLVVIAIELRDVEDLLIVNLFKAIERGGLIQEEAGTITAGITVRAGQGRR